MQEQFDQLPCDVKLPRYMGKQQLNEKAEIIMAAGRDVRYLTVNPTVCSHQTAAIPICGQEPHVPLAAVNTWCVITGLLLGNMRIPWRAITLRRKAARRSRTSAEQRRAVICA